MMAGLIVAAAVAVAVTVVGFAARGDSVQISVATVERVTGSSSSTQLEVTYLAGDSPECGKPSGVEVDESQKAVTLTARISRDIPTDGSRICPAVGVPTTQIVTLKSPLGARPVLDAFQLANGEAGIVEVKAP